ncbi:hypothetical protein PTI98_010172 [Pleurotus ostreatus]|nr:hypothetical protein PTI98_010172 [Pleurotus ostreatus]
MRLVHNTVRDSPYLHALKILQSGYRLSFEKAISSHSYVTVALQRLKIFLHSPKETNIGRDLLSPLPSIR